MRLVRIAAIVAAVCILGTPRASAGIYSNDPLDQLVSGPLSLGQFQNVLGVYLSATSPQMPQHQRYLNRVKELEALQHGPFGLSTEDRVTLSAYYLRLLQAEKAAQVLRPVEGERNFMVHANLATAHQMSGRLERAADYQEMALREWPSAWPGMTQNQLSWFYRVEKYYQALLRARLREERLAPGKPSETLDEIFPGVAFVGPDDRYQAGAIAPLQAARMPADALPVVQQLVLWLPTDERLSWLLAEVLNANGFIADAWGILDSLSNRGYSPKALKEHRQALKEAVPVALAWTTKMAVNDEFLRLLWAVSPRGGAAPGSSPVMNEIGWAVGLGFIRSPEKARERPDDVPSIANRDTPRTDTAWLPSVRHVVVSFLAGVALTLLAGMQLREMRRRREGAAAKG